MSGRGGELTQDGDPTLAHHIANIILKADSRAAQDGAAPPSTPAEKWLAEARQHAERYANRRCLHCGDDGAIVVPAVTRGSLRSGRAGGSPVRPAGRPRHIEVVELPRREWAEGMRVAGDAGFGWSGDQWARIRAGEMDPDGRRFTGRPDA
jgi:hypothetical protein